MDVVIDDHLLLRVLLGDEPPELRAGGGRVVTPLRREAQARGRAVRLAGA